MKELWAEIEDSIDSGFCGGETTIIVNGYEVNVSWEIDD